PAAKNPFAEKCGKNLLAYHPGRAGVVGLRSPQSQGQGSDDLGEGRVLLVQAQIELLKIADACADMRYLVDRGRLAASRSPSKNRHQSQKKNCGKVGEAD